MSVQKSITCISLETKLTYTSHNNGINIYKNLSNALTLQIKCSANDLLNN